MRKSINSLEVHKHKNPIPHACILNGLMISSAINGFDHSIGNFPDKKETQIEIAFENMLKILKEANGAYENILKIDLYFNDKSDRKFVNPIWLRIFPNENTRPARHSHLAILDQPCIMQLVFTAVI
jgi:enamine deaminase RidA (YjgF/YER057c/UK114 family)